MTYHLVRAGAHQAACVDAGLGTLQPGDQLVPEAEANDPAGRHFNCTACHRTLTGGQRHVTPPETTDG